MNISRSLFAAAWAGSLASSGLAGVSGSASGFLQVNQTITPVVNWTSSISIQECMAGDCVQHWAALSAQKQTSDMAGDFLVQASLQAMDKPASLVMWADQDWPSLTPPFQAGPCGPRPAAVYGRLSGRLHMQSISGPAPPPPSINARQATVQMKFQDTIEIIASGDVTIALPLSIRGWVSAAEPFGIPKTTNGWSELSLAGTLGDQTIDHRIKVGSTSVFPQVITIDEQPFVPVALKKGANIVEADIVAEAFSSTSAQGGSSQSTVNFEDGIIIGRFAASDGGALPAGLLIRSVDSGLVYEDTRATPRPTADLDGDDDVDGVDLGILLSQWLTDSTADLNGDHVVNGIDLGILLANWTLRQG